MLEIVYEYGEYAESISVQQSAVFAISAVSLAFILVFYLLRSIGLYKLAVNQGINKAFLAFIPCVWMFIACKLIGKARFFGNSFEKIALSVCIVFAACGLLPLVYNFLRIFPYVVYYLHGGTITISVGAETVIYASNDFVNLFDTRAINVIVNILRILSAFLSIAEIVITVFVYIALFKKFWPQHYILASVLSFFGLFSVFVFAIRNNKPVNYADYVRSRYYGYGGYGTPYNGGNGNGQNPDFGTKRDDPFSEFSDKPDEPFSEFDGRDKDDKDDN